MIQLMTRWGRELKKDHILQEYPRPNMVRDSYLNLNGEWDYCINQSKITDTYDGKILVPFSPEAHLSGVGKIVQPQDYLHYRKVFQLPQGFKKERVLLHLGAVDQECEVFLNGVSLGCHVGGYLPFSFDITRELTEGDNVLTLRVKDQTEQAPHGRGKQKLVKKGKMSSLFYTPQSGIWKTVWLESVPETYMKYVQITPLYDESAIQLKIQTAQKEQREKIHVQILDDGEMVAEAEGESNRRLVIKLEKFTAWSPENPHLYDVVITMGRDKV